MKSVPADLKFGKLKLIIGLGFLHFMFILGIGSCVALAPDELDYLKIFELIYLNNQIDTNIPGSSQLWIYYLFFGPSKILSIVGFDSLLSLRINSVILNLISVNILLTIVNKVQVLNRKEFFLYLCFFLIPSFFIFGSLALRESCLIFLLSLFFLGVKWTYNEDRKFGIILLTVSVMFMSGLKFYLSIFMILTIIVTELMYWLRKKRNPSLAITFLLYVVVNGGQVTQLDTFLGSSSVGSSSVGSSSVAEVLTSTTISEFVYCFENNQLGFSKYIVQKLFNTQIKVYVDISVANPEVIENLKGISATDFYRFDDSRGVREITHIPTGIFEFIAAPGFNAGSKVARFFLIESFLWVAFLLVFFLLLISRIRLKTFFTPLELSLIVFISIFVISSALIEVNAGTALRHRTILLIPFFIYFFGFRGDFWSGLRLNISGKKN